MKPLTKIILAAVAGTSVMTLYSYYRAKKEKQQYIEPVLLNRLMDKSPYTPSKINDNHAAGWVAHYGVGITFVTAYYFLYRKSLHVPGPIRALLVGTASGALAIAVWKLMFTSSDNPPQNNRYGYFRQLFIAHIIFSSVALVGYKLLDTNTDEN